MLPRKSASPGPVCVDRFQTELPNECWQSDFAHYPSRTAPVRRSCPGLQSCLFRLKGFESVGGLEPFAYLVAATSERLLDLG